MLLLKKNCSDTLLRNSNDDFFQGTTAVGFAPGGRDWAHLWIKQGQIENYNPGARQGSVGRKLLRGNIRGEGGFWLDRMLAEGKPEWPDAKGEGWRI